MKAETIVLSHEVDQQDVSFLASRDISWHPCKMQSERARTFPGSGNCNAAPPHCVSRSKTHPWSIRYAGAGSRGALASFQQPEHLSQSAYRFSLRTYTLCRLAKFHCAIAWAWA